jgi:hypothetical protein
VNNDSSPGEKSLMTLPQRGGYAASSRPLHEKSTDMGKKRKVGWTRHKAEPEDPQNARLKMSLSVNSGNVTASTLLATRVPTGVFGADSACRLPGASKKVSLGPAHHGTRYRKSPKGNDESGLSKGAMFSLVFPRLLFLSAKEHTKAYINPEPLCWIPSSIRATATRAPPVQNTIHPLFAPPSQNVFRKQPESRGVSRSAIR